MTVATSTFLQVMFGALIIIPIMILWVAAVVDVFRHGGSGLKIATMLVLILIVPILGPLLYFAFRHVEEPSAEQSHMARQDLQHEAAGRQIGGTRW